MHVRQALKSSCTKKPLRIGEISTREVEALGLVCLLPSLPRNLALARARYVVRIGHVLDVSYTVASSIRARISR